jgi:hypothetical protein
MNIYKTLSISYYIGMALVLTGILFQLNDISYALPLLVIGIVPFIGVRSFNFIKGKTENRRINGIMLISALFLSAAIIAIYYHRSYWVLGVLITAMLDLYVSFRKYI